MLIRRRLAAWSFALVSLSVGIACSSSSSVSSAGSSSENKCPSGPGKCSAGNSSSCNCGESCVQTALCAGCAYECVKGCATDDDCAGYYSGDTPPVALRCIGASSTMPTAHCGIVLAGSGGADSGGGSSTPCEKLPSYDHFCTAAGHPPNFEQCTGADVPGAGCEAETDLKGISCVGLECNCCP